MRLFRFLTLFASDLPQRTVHRFGPAASKQRESCTKDRFLVSGWQVIVQVGLALLKQVADAGPSDSLQILTHLVAQCLI